MANLVYELERLASLKDRGMLTDEEFIWSKSAVIRCSGGFNFDEGDSMPLGGRPQAKGQGKARAAPEAAPAAPTPVPSAGRPGGSPPHQGVQAARIANAPPHDVLSTLPNLQRLIADDEIPGVAGRGRTSSAARDAFNAADAAVEEVDGDDMQEMASLLAGLKDAKDLHAALMTAASNGDPDSVRSLLHQQAETTSRRAITPPI